MEIRLNYSDIKFQENGRLKLLIIVGTRRKLFVGGSYQQMPGVF